MIEIPRHALTLGEDMAVALEAASRAGQVIVEGFGKRYKVEEKGLANLVCAVDENAEFEALEVIEQRRPGDLIIAEETRSSFAHRGDRCWILDPLDATSAFIFQVGKDIPSVLVALREDNLTQVAVVLFPLTGEWFYAALGCGAWKNGTRLSTRGRSEVLQEAWVDMNQFGDSELETPEFALLRKRLRSSTGARLVTSQVPHSGVAARIAEGEKKISVVIHDNNREHVKQSPWDTAAPQLILEEAGGVFLNFRGERYDSFENEPIIAADSESLAKQVLCLLD